MGTFLIIVIVIIVLFIVLLSSASKEQKANVSSMKSMGYFKNQSTPTGKYIAGHPFLNNPIEKTVIFFKDTSLDIFDSTTLTQRKVAAIQYEDVTNVLIEDKTTIERRLTVTRLLLTGIFAFALKKKQVNELTYLIIEWNDGKFNHETIFEFEGKDAMTNANASRNELIKAIR